MLNSVQKASSRRQCMDARELTVPLVTFARHLADLGHTLLTVAAYSDGARHFGEWLYRIRVCPAQIDDGIVARFAHHRCRCPGIRGHRRLSTKYMARVLRFVEFLAGEGIIASSSPVPAPPVNDRVVAFQMWLREHRGLSERTIDRNGLMIMRLLPALGDDPASYDARLVRRVILAEVRRSSVPYVKTMTTALRGYLNYLVAHGQCRPWLDRAIPTVPQWRLSAMPRYLPTEEVERLIASCDPDKPQGVRDRAILLLLARLALRAGDIFDMRLDDVEWANGTLRVRGKSRRETRLPLPQDVGDALLLYLENARPRVACDHVFLRSSAPYRAFTTSSSISCVVSHALRRAGIKSAPTRGANLLRHSAATSMLRAGATLDAVGAMLRHRSANTTAHYAKVDMAMLQQVVQPWPGSVSC
jgi:site-specific recombinase XerD